MLNSIKQLCWIVFVASVTLLCELWFFLLMHLIGKGDDLKACLGVAIAFNLLCVLGIVYILGKKLYQMFFATDYIRFNCVGDDFWAPYPKWEWNESPLKRNVVNWDPVTGWQQICPDKAVKTASFVTQHECDREKSCATDLKLRDKSTSNDTSDASTLSREESDTESDLEAPPTRSAYEASYLTQAAKNGRPTAVVYICYLLSNSKESNEFLLQSLDYFAQVFTLPIYVMMNARDNGDWIAAQLELINREAQDRYGGQIQCVFTESSRSKAANQNAFIESLRPEDYKYTILYDADDRPTYNEASLLDYAEKVVGADRSGYTVVGMQGPCIDYFNDTAIGYCETMYEFKHQTIYLNGLSRFARSGTVKSQGSNNLVLSSVLKNSKFNCDCLVEDWRWSIDILEEDRAVLTYVRSMMSFGQLPRGLSSTMQRRKRWQKGWFREALYTLVNRKLFGPAWKDYLAAAMNVFYIFVVGPIFHFLFLSGFNRINQEVLAQGSFLVFVDDLFDDSRVWYRLQRVFNVSVVLVIGFTVVVKQVHFFRELRMRQAGLFLNGRDTFKYKVIHFVSNLVHSFDWLYFPLSPYYQYNYYNSVEAVLDIFARNTSEWVPTPKYTHEGQKGSDLAAE